MHEIIQLSDDLIIGKGRDRVCYEHPSAKNKCIKISITSHKQSRREVRYFSFLNKRNTDLSNVSSFLGRIETNLGAGFCFELVRNDTGDIALTLRQALLQKKTTIKEIQPKLDQLKEYLLKKSICVRDISPSNISYQVTDRGINLIIIDGVSNSNFNPLTIRLPKLIKASINKAWKGLERKLIRIEKSLEKATY